MKKLLLILAFCLVSTGAFAQCNGSFSAGQVCGTNTGGPPGPIAASSLSSNFGINVTAPPYNAKCDGVTNDATAIQAAINALPSTGGTLIFPKNCSQGSTTLNVTGINGVVFRGYGRNSSILTCSVAGSSACVNVSGGVENFAIVDMQIASTSTTNTLVQISAFNNGFALQRAKLQGGSIGLLVTSTNSSVGGSYSVRCFDGEFNAQATKGIWFDPQGSGLAQAENIIGCDFFGYAQNAFSQTNSNAINVIASRFERHLGSGATAAAIHIDNISNGAFIANYYEDDSNNPQFDIGNNVGGLAIRDSLMNLNVLGGTNTSANALKLNGTGCLLINIENVRVSISGTIGSVWNTGACPVYARSNSFDSGTAVYGFASTASGANVDIDDTIVGAVATTFSSGVAPNYSQVNNTPRMAADFSNATALPGAPVVVGHSTVGLGTNSRVLYDNSGVLGEYTQAQITALINQATSSLPGTMPAWPNNTTTFLRGDDTFAVPVVKFFLTAASVNTLAQNTTGFFWNNVCSSTEANCQVPLDTAGTIQSATFTSQSAPVAGQTYIFTVRKNGSNTSITCTISNPATKCNDAAHATTYSAGDLITVQAALSATAGANGFAVSMTLTIP